MSLMIGAPVLQNGRVAIDECVQPSLLIAQPFDFGFGYVPLIERPPDQRDALMQLKRDHFKSYR
jgi:hypothetical protein